MISFEFNNDLDILEVNYEGNISFDEMMDYGEKITENKLLPRELKTLTDVTRAKYEIRVKDVPKIIESLKKTLKKYTFIKAAFIQTKSRETALSILLGNDNDIPNYHHSVFGSKEAALEWLLN